MIFKGAM